jgi:glycosyltransferase involved in cell wall biosynthesis
MPSGEPSAAVSVILPAFNEEGAVAAQVEAVFGALRTRNLEHEVLVVDDGSQDRTAERAAAAGATVLRHAQNRGYGAALKTGIEAAANETIVIMDADGSYPTDVLPELIDRLEDCDMVVGTRTGKEVSIPLARRPAKWILRLMAARIAGRRIPDLNSGFRSFRRSTVRQYAAILPDMFSFTTTITLAFLADGYAVTYHPINYYPRIGDSKIRPRHFSDFVILVLRMAMLFQPLRIFLPLSATFGVLGVLKATFDIVAFFLKDPPSGLQMFFQPVLSTSALLLLLVGLQLLIVGLVADAILRRIAEQRRSLLPSRAVTSAKETSSPRP